MTTSSEGGAPVRTYGGWRRSRGIGLLGLGPAGTLTVVGAITLTMVSASISIRAVAVFGPLCLVVLLAALLRWDGEPVLNAVRERLRWALGATLARTPYRGGPMGGGEHAWQLPGVLAPTTLISATDRTFGDFGVVHNRRLGTMTATLRCAANSTWLADPDEAAAWVTNWGGWLASLGYLPTLRFVTITVASAPDPGSRLADYVAAREVPHAPASARRVLRQLVQAAPAAAADVQTWVSITFDPWAAPTRPNNVDEALAGVARVLPGLQDSLGSCGVAVLGRASATDLLALVRSAFDPSARAELDHLFASRRTHSPRHSRWPSRSQPAERLLDWGTAGPVATDETRGEYHHDAAVSVSWAWHEAPRQQVPAEVLARLMAPGGYPKRVSLIYRPLPAAAAARIVEREVNAAEFRSAFRRSQRRDETARDLADRERAMRNAREEASGAGVGLLSLFVTVTVLDEDLLPQAIAEVEARADTAKIRLRRMWSSQAAGFATTLPCGVCPPALANHWPH